MNVFLAWSGATSERLAEFMHRWLPSVIPSIQPFMSSRDVRKGQRWAEEVGARLARADFALLCMTATNLNSRWMHFEAGAVSRMDSGRVSGLLFDLSVEQIEFPLQQFQHTLLTKSDLWKLTEDLNALCATPLSETRLRKAFERRYPDVRAGIERIRAAPARVGKPQAEERRPETVRPSPMLRRHLPVQMPTRNLVIRQFGQQLRGMRAARGWSQSRLSSETGVRQSCIFELERGLRSPDITDLCKLARALQVSPAELLAQPRSMRA